MQKLFLFALTGMIIPLDFLSTKESRNHWIIPLKIPHSPNALSIHRYAYSRCVSLTRKSNVNNLRNSQSRSWDKAKGKDRAYAIERKSRRAEEIERRGAAARYSWRNRGSIIGAARGKSRPPEDLVQSPRRIPSCLLHRVERAITAGFAVTLTSI